MNTTQEDKMLAGGSQHNGTKQVSRGAQGPRQAAFFEDAFDGLASWGTTLGRVILGLVLAWFGYHELVVPKLWTGYIPLLSPTSQLSQILVLVHGVILAILAIGLIAGVMPRLFAAIASLVMLEIVTSLMVTAGLSDLVLRDIGVQGLAVSVMASRHERLVLES